MQVLLGIYVDKIGLYIDVFWPFVGKKSLFRLV